MGVVEGMRRGGGVGVARAGRGLDEGRGAMGRGRGDGAWRRGMERGGAWRRGVVGAGARAGHGPHRLKGFGLTQRLQPTWARSCVVGDFSAGAVAPPYVSLRVHRDQSNDAGCCKANRRRGPPRPLGAGAG